MNPRSSPRRLRLPAAALLPALAAAAIALGGCGGSGSSASTTTTTTTTTATQGAGGGSGGRGRGAADASIRRYGSAAQGAEKTAAARAALSFFAALAARDYARICAGLTAPNRAEVVRFAKAVRHHEGGCAAGLPELLRSSRSRAAKAAHGTVQAVRVKGSSAFVIFKAGGGAGSTDYFVLKREGGSWRAISLVPGLPLDPPA